MADGGPRRKSRVNGLKWTDSEYTIAYTTIAHQLTCVRWVDWEGEGVGESETNKIEE